MSIKLFALTAILATPLVNSTASADDYYDNQGWGQGKGSYRIEVQEDRSYPYGRDQYSNYGNTQNRNYQNDQYSYGNPPNRAYGNDQYNYGNDPYRGQMYSNDYRDQGQYQQGYGGHDRLRRALDRRAVRNLDVICAAIKQQKRLEITVVSEEIENKRELKIESKKIIVEPYAFGMTSDGKPAFYGKAVEDVLEKEMTIKFGKDRFDDNAINASASAKDEKVSSGWFGRDDGISGWFGGRKNKDIDFRFIKDIRIVEGSRFEAPKDFEGYHKDNVQIICQLPVTKKAD